MSDVMSDDYMPSDLSRFIDPRRRRGGIFNLPWQQSTTMDPSPAPDLAGGSLLGKVVGNDLPEQGGFTGNMRTDQTPPRPIPHPASMEQPDDNHPLSGDAIPGPAPDTHMADLEARRAKMEQPLGWKRKLLQAGMVALPVGLGAAFGGAEGAAGAAQGVVEAGQNRAVQAQKEKDLLSQQIEAEHARQDEATRQAATQGSMDARARATQEAEDRRAAAARAALDPLHQAQIRNIDSEIEARKNPKSAKETQDEFERLWANDPKNQNPDGTIKKPTLADKANYEKTLKPPKEPPEPSYTPMVDTTGKVIGRWNNRTGNPEPLTQKIEGAPEGGFRKTGMGGAQVTREIQTGAVAKSEGVLSEMLDDPKIKAKMGPGAGRWQTVHQWLGDASPEAMDLKAAVHSYMMLQPGVHAMRSSEMVSQLDKQFGNLKMTPESMKAAIHGLGTGARAVHEATQDFYGTNSNKEPDEVYERGKDGKLHLVKKGGQ